MLIFQVSGDAKVQAVRASIHKNAVVRARAWRILVIAGMAMAVLCCSGLTWAAHVGLRSLLAK